MNDNPFHALRLDIERYTAASGRSWLAALLTNQELWVICQYRISRWVHHHVHLPVVRQLQGSAGLLEAVGAASAAAGDGASGDKVMPMEQSL